MILSAQNHPEAWQSLLQQQSSNWPALLNSSSVCCANETDDFYDNPDTDAPHISKHEDSDLRYDRDVEHSKRRHKKNCKAAQRKRCKLYDGLVLPPEDKEVLDALSGRNGLRCVEPRVADFQVNNKIGGLFNDHASRLFERSKDTSFHVFSGTFLNDQRAIGPTDALVQVRDEIDKLQKVIRNYSYLSAIGRGEGQPILGWLRGSVHIWIYWHYHIILFGYDQEGPSEIVKRAKGFQSKLTSKPILFQKLEPYEGSFTQNARYVFKPDFELKRIDWDAFDAGVTCLERVRSYPLEVEMRIFELQAKLPIQHSIFGVREGKVIKEQLIRETRIWHKRRASTPLDVQDEIYPVFHRLIQNNDELSHLTPLKVKYQRNQQCQ